MGAEGKDVLVEALRDELRACGLTRVILLGQVDDMREPRLKVGLARWGFQVLVPPAAEQEWLGRMLEGIREQGELAPDDERHLATLLADGAEHGVEGFVLTRAELRMPVERCGLGLPVVAAWALEEWSL